MMLTFLVTLTAILLLSVILVLYWATIEHFLFATTQRSPDVPWDFLQFLWRILTLLGGLWSIGLGSAMLLVEAWPEWSYLSVADYPHIIAPFLRPWLIALLPGIPSFITLGTRIASYLHPHILYTTSGAIPAQRTVQRPNLLGLIIALITLVVVLSLALPGSVG
jgi:hypothetical protein